MIYSPFFIIFCYIVFIFETFLYYFCNIIFCIISHMSKKFGWLKNVFRIGILLILSALNLKAERIRLFTPNDGLSNSHINQIYQDSKGYIWIATENGLNKFNGYDFETFLSIPNDSASIQSNFVTHVFEDSRGLFWVSTSNGLLQYDRTRNTFVTWKLGNLNEIFKGNRVNSILEDRNHNLWISFPGNGVVKLDAQTLSPSVFNRQNSGISDNTITCMLEDRYGNLWFGTEDRGVFVFNPQNYTVKHFYYMPSQPSGLSSNRISAICENADGAIWVGTIGGGINVFDEQNQSFHALKTDKNSMGNLIYSLLLDDHKTVWVGTDGAGIFKYDVQGNKTTFGEEAFSINDLKSAKVHALFQDKQGNIWAALHQKGVLFIAASGNYFQNIGFNPFDASKSIGTHCVISIVEDHQGNVWTGTDGDGLYRIQPSGNIDHFTSKNTPGIVDNVITALFEDRDHYIWIGTYMNGFFRYDPQTGKFDSHYQKTDSENGLSFNHVTVFTQDDEGNLWIGTNGSGISVFNPKTRHLKQYLFFADRTKNQLSSNWVFDVIIDRDKGIWAATSNGLDHFNPVKDIFEGYAMTNANRIISNLMYSLCEDHRGNIWVGSYFGLHCIDKSTGKPTLITTLDGLPDNMIAGIEEDRDHALWISTGKGLCRYHPESNEFMSFFAEDGIQSNEFRRGCHFKGKNDKMYFGGINGMTTFYPSRISLENPLLDLVFTDFLVYNEPVRIGQSDILKKSLDETERIQLKYNQRSFTFQFAALEFAMPQRVNYYTRMENFDTQWNRVGSSNRSVTYTNLNPGSYIFKVKATIDGKNVLQKDMEVVILPPWWRSFPAKIVYVILVFLLMYSVYAYLGYRLRQRRILMDKEQQKQLSESKLQFFTDISHEIRTPLTLIIGPLEKLLEMKIDDTTQASLRIMYQNALRILRLINQLMDLRAMDKGKLKLKVEPVDLLDFIRNIMNLFTELANTRQITFNLRADGEYSSVYIDKDCLDKIIFNLLSNAFKFTPQGGNVTIDVQTEGTEQLIISVSDSGIGIAKEQQEQIFNRFYQIRDGKRDTKIGTGIGLHLAKMMAELHHGSLQVESEPDEGSTFIIKIPLNATVYEADEFGAGNEEAPVIMFQPSVPVFTDEKNEEKLNGTRRSKQDSVLIVEDDMDILRYIESELSADYHVYTAISGKEGLTKALQYLPHVIVSDVVMPEMDGLTLCKLIKTNEKTCHIPVILLTAKTSIEQRIEGLEMGADAYIPKPFNIRHLKTRIGKLIQLRETLKQKYTGELEVTNDEMKVVTSDEKLLHRFNEKLKEQLTNPDLNVDYISKELGISRVHLNRRLKTMTGDSPGDYIRNYRLKHAEWLLTNKNMTIAEVAYAVGFSSQAYFSNIFKKHYGMSPTEYVETHEKGK